LPRRPSHHRVGMIGARRFGVNEGRLDAPARSLYSANPEWNCPI
jgi:hypothetical protein